MRRIRSGRRGAGCSRSGRRRSISFEAGHADRPWPAGAAPTSTSASWARSRAASRPAAGDRQPPRRQRHERPRDHGEDRRPDGYTISQLAISAFRVPHMQKVDWDPINDFTYIIGLAGYTFGVVVKADSPFKTFNDLLAYARANPGKLSYATPGTGTSLHLAMEEVAAKAGVQFLHVPFKGYAGRRHRPDGRARHGAGRFHRLGQARWTPAPAPARHARRQAHALGRADGEGARAWTRCRTRRSAWSGRKACRGSR